MQQAYYALYDAQPGVNRLSLGRMISDVHSARELIWMFFFREFTTRYKQSALGYVWAVVPTLLNVILFSVLARNRVLSIGETGLPYPLYVLLGLTVWGLFAGSLTAMTTSLTAAANVIQKIRFPRESLVFASIGTSLFDTCIRVILLIGLFLWYGATPSLTVLAAPLILMPLLLLSIGFGLMLSVANAVLRDFGSLLALFLQFGMFLTPVIYPPPTTWPLEMVNYLNPVSPFLIAIQDLAIRGHLTMPWNLAFASLASILVFFVGWWFFRLAQPVVGERI